MNELNANVYVGDITFRGEPARLNIINVTSNQKTDLKMDIPIHHIQILDRSGSMRCSIEQLIEDCKKTINMMKPDDYYTIIWFSSAGEYRTILKGIKNTEDTKESSFRVLDSIKSVLGCTCFSESIEETERIIAELEALCPNFSITLFTDGEAVTPWSTSEEHNRVNKVLERIYDKIIAFNTIGYGNYCNEEILESWSMYSEFGEFIHSSKIDEYHEIFNENMIRARNLDNCPIDLELKGMVFFYCTTNSVTQMRDHCMFRHSDKEKNQFIFITHVNESPCTFKLNGVEYSTSSAHKIPDNWVQGILYRLAYATYVYGDRYDTMKILGKDLQDKIFVDKQINAFSPDEVGNFKKELKKAAFRDSKLRNPNTCDSNYVPDEDAPCVLDLLSVLADSENNFYVPSENYNRIGRKTTDEFNMFKKSNDVDFCPISDLIFNEEKLNISIRFRVNGSVSLNPKQAEKVHLASEYPCCIYRTHTIVKDGYLNMDQIQVCIDDNTLAIIEDKFPECLGARSLHDPSNNHLVILDLTKLPIINAAYGNASIEDVFTLVAEENLLKAKIKVAKEIAPKTSSEERYFTPEQSTLLEEYGIKNGVYNGIKNSTPSTSESDFYMSRTFKLALKGFSSLSKVIVENRTPVIPKPKKSDLYLNYVILTESYRDSLAHYKSQLAQIRAKLSAIRIAKILTGKWFDPEKLSDYDSKGVQTYADVCPFTGTALTMNIKTAYEKTYF